MSHQDSSYAAERPRAARGGRNMGYGAVAEDHAPPRAGAVAPARLCAQAQSGPAAPARAQRSSKRSLSDLPSQSVASAGASLRSVSTGQPLASSALSATKPSWPAGTSSSG